MSALRLLDDATDDVRWGARGDVGPGVEVMVLDAVRWGARGEGTRGVAERTFSKWSYLREGGATSVGRSSAVATVAVLGREPSCLRALECAAEMV